MSGTKGVGTPHNIERKLILGGGTPHILCWGGDTAQHLQIKVLKLDWVVGSGRVGSGLVLTENNTTL